MSFFYNIVVTLYAFDDREHEKMKRSISLLQSQLDLDHSDKQNHRSSIAGVGAQHANCTNKSRTEVERTRRVLHPPDGRSELPMENNDPSPLQDHTQVKCHGNEIGCWE